MKSFLVMLLATGGVFAGASTAAASTWDIDPAHTALEFSVRHMMVSTVKGQFEKLSGTVNLDDKDLAKSTVEVSVDVASVSTHEPKRDTHLKSPDFFDVAKYPVATFKSSKVQKQGGGKLKIFGALTLHGVTKPVVLEAEGPTQPYKTPFGTTVRGVHATGKINRKDFDIGWNNVLDNGGVVVGNEVGIELNAELSQKPEAAAAASAAK